MRTVRNGDPIKAIRKAVDNSLMGRLLGLSGGGPVSDWDAIPQYNPNQSVYDVDPAGLPSSIDTFIRDFTPVGDIQTLIESVKAAKDGNYAIAALGPLLMVLPQALGNKLKGAVKQIDDARGLGGAVREGEVVKALAELDNIGDEVMKFRQSNPQALDQAMMESVQGMSTRGTDIQSLPFRAIDSKDLAVDALAANRQRALGYTGLDPLAMEVIPSASSLPMGGIPITSVDPRGMQMVTGTPSERAVQNAMMHQRHGSTNKTGLLGSDEMQRFAVEKDLNRIPIPGTKFSVLRDGDVIPLKASEIREGDIITSLSQQAPQGQMGMDRIVSTSGRDLGDLDEMFGSSLMQGFSVSEVNFFESAKFKSLPKKKQIKLTELYKSTDDPKVAVQFDDMAYGLGLGKESSDLFPHNKTNYQNPMSMKLFEESFEGGLELGELTVPDRNLGMYLKKAAPPLVKDLDVNNPAFKITNTKGMPITRADSYRPGGRNYLDGAYAGEDEFGISAKQAFKVLNTGLEEQGVPFMLLSPETRKKFKYSEGGKIKVNKKRPDGFQVKKYLHGGVHGDPPYTAAPDATSVSMPDLQLLSVLQSLSDTRPTGPTIGPATPIDEDRYNREVRRRDAIARGVNPNLAFMMPAGLQGDPQAAAEYQQDNMLTSPIGQIATAMAFTPIDRAIEAALPFIPSTYAGRQINRFGQNVANKGESLMKFLLPKSEETAMAIQKAGTTPSKTAGFATESKIGEGYSAANEVYYTRMREYFSPEGQSRMRNQLSEDLTLQLEILENSLKASSGANTPSDKQILKLVNKLRANVINGKVSPTSKLVNDELDLANRQVRSVEFKAQTPEADDLVRGVGLPEEELMAMDAEYMQLAEARRLGVLQYDDLVRKIEGLEQAGQYGQARMEEFKLAILDSRLNQDYPRLQKLKSDLDAETGGIITDDAYHHGGNKEIVVGGYYLQDPTDARVVTAHEIQHALQRPSSNRRGILGRGDYGIDNQLQLNKDLGELLKYERGTFAERQAAKNHEHITYYERARTGTEIERGAFVAELRQDMIDKGFAKGSYDYEITPDRIKQYLEESYYKKSPRPGYRPEKVDYRGGSKGKLRIVELFDFENPRVREIVSNAMNRLPAALPAVGAAGAAAGSKEYRYGGKIKVKKKKKSGYKTV